MYLLTWWLTDWQIYLEYLVQESWPFRFRLRKIAPLNLRALILKTYRLYMNQSGLVETVQAYVKLLFLLYYCCTNDCKVFNIQKEITVRLLVWRNAPLLRLLN